MRVVRSAAFLCSFVPRARQLGHTNGVTVCNVHEFTSMVGPSISGFSTLPLKTKRLPLSEQPITHWERESQGLFNIGASWAISHHSCPICLINCSRYTFLSYAQFGFTYLVRFCFLLRGHVHLSTLHFPTRPPTGINDPVGMIYLQ